MESPDGDVELFVRAQSLHAGGSILKARDILRMIKHVLIDRRRIPHRIVKFERDCA